MMILFVVLSFVMVFILIWQQIQHKKLVREIDYITSRLDTISVISENGFVLIPTDNDKYISLRLTTSNGKNIIEIEDRGDGISPQQQKQIFERNYTTARKTSGSGLGLSISKCLAEQIGADLEVYSVQNEQTIFSIILKKLENR